jgi:hypothetical protein
VDWQEVQERDMEVRELAYRRGVQDALDGLPEDPDPGIIVAGEGAYRYMLVWCAYVEGRVDGGAELPF